MDLMDKTYTPNKEEIFAHLKNPCMEAFCYHIETKYQIDAQIQYSGDVYKPGWNLKYRKAGKALCTLYPGKDQFTVLVVVGRKEKEAVEEALKHMDQRLQYLYQATKEGNHQRWLMIDITACDAVFDNTLELIALRRKCH